MGRGYRRSGPTGYMPDRSDTFKVVQRAKHFKAVFSMAVERAIADIALTRWGSGGIGPLDLSSPGVASQALLSTCFRRTGGCPGICVMDILQVYAPAPLAPC